MIRTAALIAPAALLAGLIGVGTLSPSPAFACNPDDCERLTSEERKRDRAEIRRLNREQLRYVQRRDAEYARGWDATRQHSDEMAAYEAEREAYERRMAAWREAVRRCEAGDYRYCRG